MSRFSATTIDLSQLPAPDVIDALSYASIRQALIDDFLTRYPAYDLNLLEVDPAVKILEVDAATAKLQADAQVRGAENAAQSEREAAADETESAARDRRVEELTQRIAELEGRNAVCGTLSRDAVRALNTAR